MNLFFKLTGLKLLQSFFHAVSILSAMIRVSLTILHNNEVPINLKAAAFKIQVKEIFTVKTKRRF
jgi:hypothetical protein